MLVAPLITWALVRTSPSFEMTMPVPAARPDSKPSLVSMSTTPTSRTLAPDEPLLEEPEPFALEPPEPVLPFSVEPPLAEPVPLTVPPPEGAAGVRGARGVGAVAALEGEVAVELSRRAEDTGMAIAAPSAAAPIASATLPNMLPRRRGGSGGGPAAGAA